MFLPFVPINLVEIIASGGGMKDLKTRLKKVGQRFGIDITPENVDQIIRETWEKYKERGSD